MARQNVEPKLNAGYNPARMIVKCPNCAHELDLDGCRAHAQNDSGDAFEYDCRCGEIMTVNLPAAPAEEAPGSEDPAA